MIRAMICAGLLAGAAWGRQFEVASVREHVLRGGPRYEATISGNRVSLLNHTLSALIQEAYGVKDYQHSGAPMWAADREAAFDISARAEGDATPTQQQVNVMVQKLLAERFQLKLHRETRDLPVYDLVVAKGGPKLKPSAADERSNVRSAMNPVFGNATATATTMEQLARMLTADAGRPVLDKTGISGAYDFRLQRAKGASDAAAVPFPDLFTAIQEQLGLKLQAAKASTEMLVIDHVEKPSDN